MMLDDVARVNWAVATRTYGSDHATLIGLTVSWWNGEADSHCVLDEGPGIGWRPNGRASARCDALLCKDSCPVAVVEVEGTRYCYTLEKIKHLFDSNDPAFRSVKVAILVAYANKAVGRGHDRQILPVPSESLVKMSRDITGQRPGKSIVLVAVDKRYERITEGIRAKSEYYWGTVSRIEGCKIAGGQIVAERRFWPEE